MQKVIIDANVFIASLIRRDSAPARAIELALEQHLLILSDEVFSELREKLFSLSPKLAKYIRQEDAQELLAILDDIPRVPITEHISVCRDPKDDMFLSLAVSAKADCIVSGDKDLLTLHPFRSIPIVPPADFLAHFQSE